MQAWMEARNANLRSVLQVGESPGLLARLTRGRSEDASGQHLMAMVRIADELRRCRDVESLCGVAVEMAMNATQANRGVLALRDGEGFEPRASRQRWAEEGPVRPSHTFVDRVVREGVALIAVDTGQVPVQHDHVVVIDR